MSDLIPIEGGTWREIDYREDSWHKVWLGWEKVHDLVAVVMSHTVHGTIYFNDGGVAETSEEEVIAAIVPPEEATESFIHPYIAILRHGV